MNKKQELLKGNIALAEGAISAGCDAYFGYPITPQNELIAHMSKRMIELGRAFVQAESEISAINMVFGAAAAGRMAMTSSSSPGISLKQEGISYLAGCELPAVIVNVQRGGPGLGNISGSQGDYYQSTRGGGHGDYRTMVYAPYTVAEMFQIARQSFVKAFEYRNPVLIHTDGVLGQMVEPVDSSILDTVNVKVDSSDWALTGAKGREPRFIKSLLMGEGDLEAHNLKLMKKYETINMKEILFEENNTEDAEIVIIAYGISARIALSAIESLRSNGIKAGLLRPITLWPFPSDAIKKLADSVKVFLSLELSLGQMVDDVRLAVNGMRPVEFYGRAGGGIFDSEEVEEKIKEILRKYK
ncbi:MAG: 3-methyl-2-oxobutanoate dehydrogenase subunit VorB [Elusimicrobiota bacterium]